MKGTKVEKQPGRHQGRTTLQGDRRRSSVKTASSSSSHGSPSSSRSAHPPGPQFQSPRATIVGIDDSPQSGIPSGGRGRPTRSSVHINEPPQLHPGRNMRSPSRSHSPISVVSSSRNQSQSNNDALIVDQPGGSGGGQSPRAEQQNSEVIEQLWDRYNRLHAKVGENAARLEAQATQLHNLEIKCARETQGNEQELAAQGLELALLREELAAKKEKLQIRSTDSQKYSTGLADMQASLARLKQQMALQFVSKSAHSEYLIEEAIAKEHAVAVARAHEQQSLFSLNNQMSSRSLMFSTGRAASALGSIGERPTPSTGFQSITALGDGGGGVGNDPLCNTMTPVRGGENGTKLIVSVPSAAQQPDDGGLPSFFPVSSGGSNTAATPQYASYDTSPLAQSQQVAQTAALVADSRQPTVGEMGALSSETFGGYSVAGVGGDSTKDTNPLNMSSENFSKGIEMYDVVDLDERKRRVKTLAKDPNHNVKRKTTNEGQPVVAPAAVAQSSIEGFADGTAQLSIVMPSSPIIPVDEESGPSGHNKYVPVASSVANSFQAIHQLQIEFAPPGSAAQGRSTPGGRVSPGWHSTGPFSTDSFASAPAGSFCLTSYPQDGSGGGVGGSSVSPMAQTGPAWMPHGVATTLLRKHNRRFDEVLVDWVNAETQNRRPSTPTGFEESVQFFPHEKFVA